MGNKIKQFFNECELMWDAVPSYVKVFLYSTTSILVGAYIGGEAITVKTIVIIVATNIGLYQVPRESTRQIKKIL